MAQNPEEHRDSRQVEFERSTTKRHAMIQRQVADRGVDDPLVLAAMERVPREAFVQRGYEEFAYDDAPLPIGEDQTISQPYIVAAMIAAAEVKPGDRVLEVGAGSGYAAAVLAEIASEVFTIERHFELAVAADRRLSRQGYSNVEVRVGDGTLGWIEKAPFDAILVAAGGPRAPEALKQQLAVGGRLVIPVGPGRQQSLLKITRADDDTFEEEDLGPVMFVPLIGEQGWSDDGAQRPLVKKRLRP